MAGWFFRRSGSRVSIQNPVRRVLQALSLSRNPMPPRTTRKSDRRKASDRTMVGTAQPLCLSASGTDGRRYESRMNLRNRKHHSVSLHDWGWTANTSCFAVAEEAFVLTSPFIERGSRKLAFAPGHSQGSHLSLLQFLFCDEPILKVVVIFAAPLQIKLVSAGLNLHFRRECMFNLGPYPV